jgi:hypothetical protein
MGELVEFKPRVSEARKQLPAGNCAEILFFMGVRIVREPAEAPQKQGRRRASKGTEAPRKRPTGKAG